MSDQSGYVNAAGIDNYSTDTTTQVAPSAAALNAPTANKGFNMAKVEGWVGSFKDFLNHFNGNKEANGGLIDSAEAALKKYTGIDFGGNKLVDNKPVPPNTAPPAQLPPTTYMGMSGPVATVVVIVAVGLIGFGVYKMVNKKK